MTIKHTPGPWHRNIKPASKYPTIWSGRNKHVAYITARDMADDEVEANITLVAAAPDLLATLERTRQWMEDCMMDTQADGLPSRRAYDAVCAAIAKATAQ